MQNTYAKSSSTVPATLPTIALFHASIGNGHRVAAEAIAQALTDATPQARPEVRDVLAFGRARQNDAKLRSQSFTGVVGPVYDWLWRHLFTGRIIWDGSPWIARLAMPAFTHWVAERRPAAVVCTHADGANLAVGARKKTGLNFPLICVPTDYGVHGLWPHAHTDLFCVATDEIADELRRRGVASERIAVTGIPVKAAFSEKHSDWRSECAHDSTRILIIAGAGEAGPYRDFRRLLNAALPQLVALPELHATIVCGKDEDYLCQLEQQLEDCARRGSVHAHIELRTYVDDIADLMATSDLAVVKAGGLTCAECLTVGTPLLIVGSAYGQEGANARALCEAGAALCAGDTESLVHEVTTFLNDPSAVTHLREATHVLRRPRAAADIVHRVLELIASI